MDETKQCALCGEEGDWRVDTLPMTWYDYLHEQRDYWHPTTPFVPYCPDCFERWKRQRDLNRSNPADDEGVASLLDDLILDNLTGVVTQ